MITLTPLSRGSQVSKYQGGKASRGLIQAGNSFIGIKNIKFAIETVKKHFFLEAKNSKNYFLQVGLGSDCWRTSQTCPV